MTRDLNQLTKQAKEKAVLLEQEAEVDGIKIIFTGTFRSFEEQDYLYSIGRTRHGKIITYLKGGQSFHNCRRAWDIGIIKNKKVDYKDIAKYKAVGAIGVKLGLTWGGNWKKFKDYPHFQWDFCEKCKKRHRANEFKESGECKKK
jgi:peptidoglycan L-alanyl-D-glutamate endopeptidase CwlK